MLSVLDLDMITSQYAYFAFEIVPENCHGNDGRDADACRAFEGLMDIANYVPATKNYSQFEEKVRRAMPEFAGLGHHMSKSQKVSKCGTQFPDVTSGNISDVTTNNDVTCSGQSSPTTAVKRGENSCWFVWWRSVLVWFVCLVCLPFRGRGNVGCAAPNVPPPSAAGGYLRGLPAWRGATVRAGVKRNPQR